MKFNKLVLILIVAFISVIAVSCSSGTKDPKENDVAAVSESEKVVIPKEKPDLTGKVKEIIGNEVTVYKVQVDVDEARPGEESQNSANEESNQNNQGSRQQNRVAGFRVTEETETFIIPVGAPIVTMQRRTGETNTIELTEIKKDQILRVWKKNDAVELVQVMGGAGGRPGSRENAGGNGERPGGAGGMGPMGGMGGNRQP